MMPAADAPGRARASQRTGALAWRPPFTLPDAVLFVIPIVLAWIVYLPITDNYFFADDFIHFFRIRNEGVLPYLLIPRGGHLLFTSNSFFLAMDLMFGPRPQPYFWLALLTHLMNVGLLFIVIRLFTRSSHLACFGAALWGISPMNESALGWHSVYGQVLVATGMLLLLCDLGTIANGRERWRVAPLLWCLLLLGACTSFGSGIGLTMAMPLIAFLLLPPSPIRRRVVRVFIGLAILVPGLYFALSRITTVIYMPRTAGVMFDPNPITNLLMLSNLVGYGIESLLVGHATLTLDYPSTPTYLVIGLFLAATAAVLLTAPATLRRRLLAFLLLCLALYGIIVLGRAAFFGLAGRPQAFIKPTRYHYVAPIPLAIAVCLMLDYAGTRYRPPVWLRHGLLLAWLVAAVLVYSRLGRPIDHHFNARRETETVLFTVRNAIDAGTEEGVYVPNKPFASLGPIFVGRQDIFPGWAGVFVIFFGDNRVDGKPVYFLTMDEKALAAAPEGRRTKTLLTRPPS